MLPSFTLPTLVTLTAPTCAGKNFLLEELISKFKFERIVSTTDRPSRTGEVEGVHYNFISTSKSKQLEADGELAELITYNGVRYGVTHAEMEKKMRTGRPPIVILEPQGLEIYRKYCASKGWGMFTVFVQADEQTRVKRLGTRTALDILELYADAGRDGERVDALQSIIHRNNSRLVSILDNERSWIRANLWDVVVSGTDISSALDSIKVSMTSRNNRSAIYQ